MSVALGRASLAQARSEAQSDPPARGAVHRLPCRVHCTGPARVAAFFSPAVRTGDGDELKTSFRGRELKGRAVPLPPGYSGVVVREESAGTSVRHEDRRATALRAFSAISHWNLETAPSGDDALPMALGWPALADAIHGSEDEDD
ncbi:ribonuclease H2 subunit C [Petromyzon marinus]|uniref:ribonuclease H2 subunit C n=1 Tax=Petromyzon marinus TaxID=7757 RepID=UPI003F6F8AB1